MPYNPLYPDDFSDAGNAAVFVGKHGDKIRWTQGGGFFVWNGKVWEKSENRAKFLAVQLTQDMLIDALDILHGAQSKAIIDPDNEAIAKNLKAAKAYYAHAQASRSNNRLDALLKISISYPVIGVKLSDFDPDPLRLNTPAGIINLATGEIKPHDPTAMCSKITACSPDTKGLEIWGEFIKTITCYDEDLAYYLQQIIGLSIIGAVYEESAYFAVGGGRNGKSTFFNAIADILGDYSVCVPHEIITADQQSKKFMLPILRGCRMALTGELEEHRRLSTALLKAVTSTDEIRAEEKYKTPESFKPTHSLFLFTNHLPRVGSTDNGTWRRIKIIPFNAVIESDSTIMNYGQYLVENAGGAILRWAIDGAAIVIRNGFKIQSPPCVETATEEYKGRENWVSNFIDDCCELNTSFNIRGGQLYQMYKEWATGCGEFVRRQADFVDALQRAGYKKHSPQNKVTWIGIGSKPPEFNRYA